MKTQNDMNEKMRKQFEQSEALWEDWQAQLAEKLKDPVKRRAWELAEAGRELVFAKKRFDEGIQKLTEAMALDSDYTSLVEGARKFKNTELRKGPVRLAHAVNRILFPRLRELGFRQQVGEDSPTWKEGTMQVRTSSHGREGAVYMGRTKFGKRFGLNVWRHRSNGEIECLDLSTVGLDDESLSYLNQEEANAVLERVATAFEGPILAWLDEDG
ncbi:hypothetical protein JXQ70_19070 [bacterium]|nr:hypothetical protein [bacterium]